MKRVLLTLPLLVFVLAGCATGPATPSAAAPKLFGANQILPFVHIDGFGTEDESAAWLAWEFEAQTYVKYQVAYTSCTCRPESINARSLLYVEVTKQGAGSRIKRISFNYWGDSPKMPSGITREEVETGFMPKMPGTTLTSLAGVDVVAGATVTTINLKQIGLALLQYHQKAYPVDTGIVEDISVDTVAAATEE